MTLPPTTLLLMGIQGSGKGTQANLLVEKFGYAITDMGKLLRKEQEQDTDRGRLVHEMMTVKGELVPDDVSTPIMLDAIRQLSSDQRLIVDGHPRTLPQTDMLFEGFDEIGRKDVTALFLTLTDEEAIERLSKRRVCEACKGPAIFDADQPEKTCEACGGKLIQREDDTPEKIRTRLAWSHDQVMPVVERFREEGRLIEVSGKGSVEEIHARIVESLKLS